MPTGEIGTLVKFLEAVWIFVGKGERCETNANQSIL